MKNLKQIIFRPEAFAIMLPIIAIVLWPQLISNFLNSNYMSHGHCYMWDPSLVILHLSSDSLIGLSYLAISITLTYMVIKARQDLPFPKMFLAFGLFIISCGATHFMEVWTLWEAVYWFSGSIKLITAIASASTAIALPFFVPKVLRLVNDAKTSEERKVQLEKINIELEEQIREREKAESELITAHNQLERRVKERTSQLQESNRRMTLEIEERKKVEIALRESETLFTQFAESIRDVFYLVDVEKDEIIYISPAYRELYGYPLEYLKDRKEFFHLIHKDDLELIRKAVEKQKETGKMNEEFRIVRPDNEIKWIRVRTFPLKNDAGKIYKISGIAEDITERKLAQKDIEESLREKELLLKEIHHRVKNNLQIVSSFLHLQAIHITDNIVQDIFIDLSNRIRAMALIHERLQKPEDVYSIDFNEYVSELIFNIKNSYKSRAQLIQFKSEIEKVKLPVELSTNLGLIINELVSNSLKHAFPNSSEGEILIKLDSLPPDNMILSIRDNGIGLPDKIIIDKSESLGLQLFSALIDQIHGKVEVNTKDGTEFKILFKK